ncbi:hypothetical protein M9458_052326 [Cirrhinus mrigala]|uniref:Retrotransposon gag domain-containing protein n=1 Tax=Cirrhinus mrigala TaxID=683832 RepID=A0ABD0MRC7_CIRMR
MDPLVSRPSVTEYSATTGSSNFSFGRHPGTDTARLLLALEQGTRSLEGYIQEFLDIAYYSDLPDCVLIDIFIDGTKQPLKSKLRREGPRSSLSLFMDFALSCVGSPFTVGVADGERDDAVMAAAPERDTTDTFAAWLVHEMAATLERAQTMAAASERVHKMAATEESIHKMATMTGLHHVTAAIPEPSHAASVFPKSSQVSKLSQVAAACPESSQVSKLSRVTAAVPEPSQVSKSSQVAAAFPESSQVSKSSQVAAAFPVSSQVRAIAPVASQITAIFPEPLHKMAAVSKQLHKMAAVSKPLHKWTPFQNRVNTRRHLWS